MDDVVLLRGDCLQVLDQIPDGSIDLILADLPYGLTEYNWDVPILFEPLWTQYERIIKDNGAIVLFSTQPFTTDLINSNRRLFRYEIVWEKTQKTGFYNANRAPLRAHENICVFYKHPPTYNPQKTRPNTKRGRVRHQKANRCGLYGACAGTDYTDDGSRYPIDVIKISNHNGAIFGNTDNATRHPTQKPVAICDYLIRTYTNPGDRVLDNCMGSGSTGVAAVNTGRQFVGIEKDEKYFEIAEQRINEARVQQALAYTD